MGGRWANGNRAMGAAVAGGLGVTLFVVLVPFARFAYDNPQLHLALETAEGMIAAHLAYLVYGRFRTTGQLRHIALSVAFALLAAVNILLAALPIVALGSRPTGAVIWAAAGFRLVALSTLCLAAFCGARLAPQGRRLGLFLLVAGAAALVAVAAFAVGADLYLADALNPSIAPARSRRPSFDSHPVVLGMQLVALGLLAAAAVRFASEARREQDQLLRWLAAGAALGAFARLHYFLFPSLYSNFVYTGDVLRLASYLFFVIGAARELDAYWRDHATVAVFEERRRLARELHDGLAQELGFIRSQTAAMAAGMHVPGMVNHVAAAAERALEESRRAIDTFAGDGCTSLHDALRVAGEEVAGRAGAEIEMHVEPGLTVAPAVAEALARIVREATGNAVRHGAARRISVRAACDNRSFRLEVTDDGQGFDPDVATKGFGLRGMRERVEALGGDLHVRSGAGRGATVEVLVPTSPFTRPSGRKARTRS